MSVRVLNSWKEIAAYMNRGVRTVQRWEHDLNLPVRRPRGKSRSAVIALADDLDAWLKKTPLPDETKPNQATQYSAIQQSRDRLHSATRVLVMQSAALHENLKRTHDLCESIESRRRKRADNRKVASN